MERINWAAASTQFGVLQMPSVELEVALFANGAGQVVGMQILSDELEVPLLTNGVGQDGVMQILFVELEVALFTNAAAAGTVSFTVKFVFWFAEQTFNAALDCLTKLFEEFSGKFSKWWT
jgi:hypothetical protein